MKRRHAGCCATIWSTIGRTDTVATDKDSEDYPVTVDEEISKSFPTGYRERAWRSFHSKQFMAKAYNVAKSLSIPTREVLFA
jgi:hypothetical protein